MMFSHWKSFHLYEMFFTIVTSVKKFLCYQNVLPQWDTLNSSYLDEMYKIFLTSVRHSTSFLFQTSMKCNIHFLPQWDFLLFSYLSKMFSVFYLSTIFYKFLTTVRWLFISYFSEMFYKCLTSVRSSVHFLPSWDLISVSYLSEMFYSFFI